ncbi:dihydrofolate reductase family protein [Agilicoccus flavus]|uniref:dihydrofolate reductase family protein n=1 Tax=Agilicoccus flavus TaxID=2775968 RepID=UPI001CF6F77A|nr:dihydrofolate reductase family protein [Agilicoccus flavus]
MRTLAITQNITLDGAIDMLGDWFDPQEQMDDPRMAEEMRRQDEACDAVLLGRQTFTDFRGFWPAQGDDETGISTYLDTVHKYVVSRTLTDPGWQNSTILSGDPVDEAARLKESDGGDIVVTGSVTLCHTLLAAGVVDELRLFTYPVVQGAGRRLLPDGLAVTPRLLEAATFADRILYSRHALR